MGSGKDLLEKAQSVVRKADLSLVDAAMAGQRALKSMADGDSEETAHHLALMVALCARATAKAERAEG